MQNAKYNVMILYITAIRTNKVWHTKEKKTSKHTEPNPGHPTDPLLPLNHVGIFPSTDDVQ